LVLVATVTYGGAASAAEVGFSVDDFAGNSMGALEVVPGNNSCTPTGGNSITMGTGTMRVNLNVPDPIGCNYANADIRWTAPTSVNIEQGGADRIMLKYRDVVPNQPSAVTFGLHLVDVNGRTADVGGLTRNGGAAGDWLTIRYTPEYVGDVAVLSFQGGFDRSQVKSVTLKIAATTNNQDVAVTFEGIGANVGEPAYAAPAFGSSAAYEFPADTTTTKTFTVTGNPAPDVSWTNEPSWMTITTSATSGGRSVTMTGNPGVAYSDTAIAFHADVANSLTADASVRIVVPSPVTVTTNTADTEVGQAGPLVVGTVTSVPASTLVTGVTGLPPGTGLAISGTNVILTGTPTTGGTYSASATLGNEFRTGAFARDIVVGQPAALDALITKTFVRDVPITPFGATATGYPAPTIAYTNLPAGLTQSGGVISGTPTAVGNATVSVTASNSYGSDADTFLVRVGDLPTVQVPMALDAVAGTALDLDLPVTGAPASITATNLPGGVTAQLSGGVAKLVGTPTVPTSAGETAGTATVTVANDFGSESKDLPWTVSAPPQISGPTFGATTVGSALTPIAIEITGYPAPTVTVTDPDDDGTLLPLGLSVDQSIAGTVTISGISTAVGTETIRVTANNGFGGAITHDVTVSARSLPAFISASPTLTVHQGATEDLQLAWSGYPTPTLSLESVLPAWINFNSATGTFTAAPSGTTSGAFGPYYVDATNSAGTVTAQVTVNVTAPAGLPPVLDIVTDVDAPLSRLLGTVTGFPLPTVTATGLPAGLSITQSGSDVTLTGTATAAGGIYPVTLVAANGVDADATTSFNVVVNRPPTVTVPATLTMTVGEPTSVTPTIGGYPKPALTAFNLPPGLAIDIVTGEISGTPLVTGEYSVQLMTVGGVPGAPVYAYTLITVVDPPEFTATPEDLPLRLFDPAIGAPYEFTGYPEATLTVTGLPNGLTLYTDGSYIRLMGAPVVSGVFNVSVTLTSSSGTVTDEWVITVVDPPLLIISPQGWGSLNQPITAIPILATGSPSPTVTATGLPEGLEIVSQGGGTYISGTPTEDGQFSVQVTADNGVGTAATGTIVIDVQSVPSLGPDLNVSFAAGETSTVTLPVGGYPAPSLTVSTLPAWLSFNASTGVFTASPTAADIGPGGTVLVNATSVAGDTQLSISLAVTNPPAVTASGGTTTVLSGDAISEGLTTVTGYPEPTMTVTGLPDGLTAALVGDALTLTGTTAEGGAHPVTFTLANGAGPDISVPWTVVVNVPPTLTLPASSATTLGDDLDLAIGATGYPLPTVTVTGLPAGLSWQPDATGGHIEGSPTMAGTFTVQVSATNGIGADASGSFLLTVDLPLITIAPSASTVVAGATVGIEAEGFQPGEEVRIELHSTPVLLATVNADSQGRLDVKVKIPTGTALGAHELVVTGATGAEGVAPITVEAAGELSGTGANLVGQLGLALAIMMAGATLLLRLRRYGERA